MPGTPPPIDLSDQTRDDFFAQLGELVMASLRMNSVCLVIARGPRELTFIPPEAIFGGMDPEVLAEQLLRAWTDDEVLDFLNYRSAWLAEHHGGHHG